MVSTNSNKPHAVCISFPAQGHISPMLKFAKLLHFHGFHITFVNTQYNHRRLLKSQGPDALAGLPDFRFEAIHDGLPPSEDDNVTQDIPSLCESTMTRGLPYVRELLAKLNSPDSGVPPVTLLVSSFVMTFAFDAAKELGIPSVLFCTPSACGIMCYLQYPDLVKRGLVPLKDESYFSNGFLDTPVDWIPGLKHLRFRDLTSFIQTVDKDDIMLNFMIHEVQRYTMPSAIVLNTFDEVEEVVLEELSKILPPIYTLGPLHLLDTQFPSHPSLSMGSNLWIDEPECLKWLHGKQPGSVLYVNFGSITVITNQQLVEFAWGLANSGFEFLWIIRPDLVKDKTKVLPLEFIEETKDRGVIAKWCPQVEVLNNPAIGGYLTHSGWNSTLETISSGVPVLSWPFFAEQRTNCRYQCFEWGIGMEIDNDVKRDVVEELIRELMGGEKGKEMKKRALEWKESAIRATQPGGSSFVNLERLVKDLLSLSMSS